MGPSYVTNLKEVDALELIWVSKYPKASTQFICRWQDRRQLIAIFVRIAHPFVIFAHWACFNSLDTIACPSTKREVILLAQFLY